MLVIRAWPELEVQHIEEIRALPVPIPISVIRAWPLLVILALYGLEFNPIQEIRARPVVEINHIKDAGRPPPDGPWPQSARP